MPHKNRKKKFFTLQKMLRMSDLQDIAMRFNFSQSYIEKVVQGNKFHFDVYKAACQRAKENAEIYLTMINRMLTEIDVIENYSEEDFKRDIELAESMPESDFDQN